MELKKYSDKLTRAIKARDALNVAIQEATEKKRNGEGRGCSNESPAEFHYWAGVEHILINKRRERNEVIEKLARDEGIAYATTLTEDNIINEYGNKTA